MTITLYKYSSERNRIDKSGYLQTVLTTMGSFKKDTSILNPTLLLALPTENLDYVTDENGNLIADVLISAEHDSVLDFNYMYIAEFRRYYYVNSIFVSSDLLLVVSGEVDPLYSFKDEILANHAMIERNEFTFDAALEDTLLPLSPEKICTEETPSNLSEANTALKADFSDDPTAKNIVVAVAQDSGNGGTVQAFANLPSIEIGRFTDAGGTVLYLLNKTNATRLLQSLMGDNSAYATFFKSLVAYPFDVTSDADNTPVTVSVWKYDTNSGYYTETPTSASGVFLQGISSRKIIADFTFTAITSFLDFAPYSHYELYIPFYGWYELDFSVLHGHRLQVMYSVNYADGSGEVYLYDYSRQRMLFTAPVQIGVSLSLTSTNAEELGAQKRAMTLNLALSLISSAAGMIGSAVTGNGLGVVGSGLSGVGAITSYVNQKSMMFERAQSSHNGAAGALYAPLTCRLRITHTQKRSGLDLDDYAHQYGRPLRDVRTLSTLSGFTQIAKVHLEGLNAMDSEKSEIESSLLAGVIL